MKKRLRDRLPYSVRKLARRAVVRVVSAAAPLLKDVLNIAATSGMDLERALGLSVQTHSVTNGTGDGARIVVFDSILPKFNYQAISASL